MLRKLKYNGKRKFLIMYPVDLLVSDGTEYTAKTKEEAEMLKELGFEEVAEGKKEIEKKNDKKEVE